MNSPIGETRNGLAPAGSAATLPDQWAAELAALLEELERVGGGGVVPPAAKAGAAGDRLAQNRLGVAGSLFAALQCKHAATAAHALRVALVSSAWARQMGVDDARRDLLEVAALLHDIGVIGVPDHVLLKPALLDRDEAGIMMRSRTMSLEILRRSCASREILKIVENVAAWHDGSRPGFPVAGEEIPLESRMIAIVEAFDAMTSDHTYRAAMSQERAMAELFECAGTQFDPRLVPRFAEFREADGAELRREVTHRWLHALDPELVNSYWKPGGAAPPPSAPGPDALFQAKLLDNMHDAAVFINAAGQIMQWNHGAERLTGVTGSSIRQRKWHPELLSMADEKGRPVGEADCPALGAIRSGSQSLRRLIVWGRNGRSVSVDTHAIPVIADDGTIQGAVLLLHDASSEISLEQRCQSLHEKATRDPMTQVANRAEFDRVHAMFVATHKQQQMPCALMICDLDHFKSVNDTYGHQAGDDVIRSLATLLKGACRPGDLVARYGGEEFVMLCADCDNATATRRAEQVRKALGQMPQPKMGGRPVTVSFGVTEIQPGDTPETMLRRADRALLMAKGKGRNTVVQLGSGGGEAEPARPRRRFWPFGQADSHGFREQQILVTPVPVQMAVEKLRGFVADHEARILHANSNRVQLEIDDQQTGALRRLTDRPLTFQLELHFEEERQQKEPEQQAGGVARTRIRAVISRKRGRDRRASEVADRARQVLASLRSYLMAVREEG